MRRLNMLQGSVAGRPVRASEVETTASGNVPARRGRGSPGRDAPPPSGEPPVNDIPITESAYDKG